KPALLRRDLGVEHDLQEHVAQLVAYALDVAAVDRVEDLVGLLDQIGPQTLWRLLAVPRATARGTQACHDVDQAGEAVERVCIGHRARLTALRGAVNADRRRTCLAAECDLTNAS